VPIIDRSTGLWVADSISSWNFSNRATTSCTGNFPMLFSARSRAAAIAFSSASVAVVAANRAAAPRRTA
jgi:hypothetical protein